MSVHQQWMPRYPNEKVAPNEWRKCADKNTELYSGKKRYAAGIAAATTTATTREAMSSVRTWVQQSSTHKYI